MLRLHRKIKNLEEEMNSSQLLLIQYKEQLKQELLTPRTMALVLLCCFLAGYYLEYQQKKYSRPLVETLEKIALNVFTFYSKFIALI